MEFSRPGRADSCIDLVYTNTPEKISQTQPQVRGSSDHRLVLVSKQSKNIRESITYVRKRSYKKFVEAEFKTGVKNIKLFEV